ncbi:MAG: carboxypeptidase-like regulatory domain-containing protein [Chitinivibrionales bacterium]
MWSFGRITVLVLLCWYMIPAQISVDISGRVEDQSGQPLSGAVITLDKGDTTVTTDSEGMYEITGVISPVLHSVPDLGVSRAVINRNQLSLSVEQNVDVRAEVFDVRGREIGVPVSERLLPGEYTFSILNRPEASGAYILRLAVGSEVSSFRLMNLRGRPGIETGHRSEKPVEQGIAKSAAVLDTVNASKAGYTRSSAQVTSWDGVYDFVLDTLESSVGTSPIEDGSADRFETAGESQYYWGDPGTGEEIPLVMISNAVTEGAVDVMVVFNPGFVDLTYGTGAQGWSPNRGHTFKDLVASDHVEIAVRNAAGDTVFHGRLDLLSPTDQTSSGYASLGPVGGDGSIIAGNESDIISYGSSFCDNINYYGYSDFENSPSTDSTFSPNPDYPNYEFYVAYRLTLDSDAFGESGYGDVGMTSVHASPAKTPDETVTVYEGDPPENTFNPFINFDPPTTTETEPPDTSTAPPDTITPD